VKTLSLVLGLFLLSGALTQMFGANVAGVWTGRIILKTPERGDQPRDITLTLKTSGSNLTGTISGEWEGHRDSAEILDGKVNGNAVSFSVPSGTSDGSRIEFLGEQDGDTLRLTISGKHDGQEFGFGDGLLKRAK
jgi:hypothetical protein